MALVSPSALDGIAMTQSFPDPTSSAGKTFFSTASTILDTLMNVYGFSYNAAIAALANAFAESSLRAIVPGDEAAAGGLWQLHAQRRNAILTGCGLDMWSGTVAQQCRGAAWELTQKSNGYLGWKQIQPAKTPEDAAEAWCRQYERPADMETDVAVRRQYATKFAAKYPRTA